MTRLEKIKHFIDKGYTYNPTTGDIITGFGKIVSCKCVNGYIICSDKINGKTISLKAHHLAYYLHYNEHHNILDHIDRNPSNNRISNLRSVTYQQNSFNRNPKGYYFNTQKNKYLAGIRIDGTQINLGFFENEEDAHQAYLDAKKIYHII